MSLLERISNLEKSDQADAFQYSFQTTPEVEYRYVIYRWVQFAVHFIIAVLSFLGEFPQLELVRAHGKHQGTTGWKKQAHESWYYPKWFLYLTSWSMFVNVVQSLIGAVTLTMAYGRRAESNGAALYGVSYYMVWDAFCVLNRVATNLAVLTLVEIWVLIIPPSDNAHDHVFFDVCTLAGLVLGAILMLVDLFAVKFTYKMITGAYSLFALTAYFGMTWVHYKMKAYDRCHKYQYIYPKLNWHNKTQTVEVIGVSVFLLEVINCGILWWLCQLKRKLTSSQQATEQPPVQQGIQQQPDHSGEPPPTPPPPTIPQPPPPEQPKHKNKKAKSPQRDSKKAKSPQPSDRKLEELNGEVTALEENLNRAMQRLEQNPQDAKLAEEVTAVQEKLKNKTQERDAYNKEHANKEKHE